MQPLIQYDLPLKFVFDPSLNNYAIVRPSIENILSGERHDYCVFGRLRKVDPDRKISWTDLMGVPIFFYQDVGQTAIGSDDVCWGRSTLGGYIKIEPNIYGLTVAHAIPDAATTNGIVPAAKATHGSESWDKGPAELCQNFPLDSYTLIGKVLASALSSNAQDSVDEDTKELRPTLPNSDWAVLRLDPNFVKSVLESYKVMTPYSVTKEEEFEVLRDIDLQPRSVSILAGFSGTVNGQLTIGRSTLHIGTSRFSVMRIVTEQELSK